MNQTDQNIFGIISNLHNREPHRNHSFELNFKSLIKLITEIKSWNIIVNNYWLQTVINKIQYL